jgi:hypothetical protein
MVVSVWFTIGTKKLLLYFHMIFGNYFHTYFQPLGQNTLKGTKKGIECQKLPRKIRD